MFLNAISQIGGSISSFPLASCLPIKNNTLNFPQLNIDYIYMVGFTPLVARLPPLKACVVDVYLFSSLKSELFLVTFFCHPSVCKLLHFNFFSITTKWISTKLSTMHPLVKGIQFYWNEGPGSLTSGDN